MMGTEPLGPMLHSFFVDHLIAVKGLRPASVRSYRDTIRLFIQFAAADKHCKITRLALTDLTFERVVGFLKHLEVDRGNHIRTRNQRLTAVHCLFEYIARACTRNAGRLPACSGSPNEACSSSGNAIPRTRRSAGSPPSPTTRRPSRAAGPGPHSSSCTTPERAFRRPPIFALNTSISASSHSCACMARATNGEPAHSGTRLRTCWHRCSNR
jgi:Phage integrase, N-terminal SAM-like domain